MLYGKELMLDSKQVEHGGMHVVYMNFIFYSVVAKFIGFSVSASGFHSTTDHDPTKSPSEMTASRWLCRIPIMILSKWSPSEFPAPINFPPWIVFLLGMSHAIFREVSGCVDTDGIFRRPI